MNKAHSQNTSALLPIAGRSMEVRNLTRAEPDAPSTSPCATAEIVFTTGAQVQRYDYLNDRLYQEELVIEPGAIRLERLQRGAPLLNTHSNYDLSQVLGVVENPIIANGIGICTATFSRRDDVAGYVQDVADKIIRNVSVGYARHKMEMTPPATADAPWVYRVTDWEPMEVSLVPIPADMDSQIRAEGTTPNATPYTLRTFACEIIEHRSMSTAHPKTPTVGISAATSTLEENSMMENQNAGGNSAPDTTTDTHALAAANTRAAEITELCVQHRAVHLAAGLIRDGKTLDDAKTAILNERARRDEASFGHRNVNIETVQDEMQIRIEGMEQALLHRINSKKFKLDDNGRQYIGMRMLSMGSEFLESSGIKTRGINPIELSGLCMHHRGGGAMGTSDFSSLMANVARKSLRNAYEVSEPTFLKWARRAPNVSDFKNITVVSLSGAPTLLKTNEHGEIKYGTMGDSAETYRPYTYSRIVSLTRQAIMNDDLGAFDRLITAFGIEASQLENRQVYAELTNNAAMADTVALFHADHSNLGTGTGSALQLSSLSTARTAMRLQKGLGGESLNISPSYLIVPAALETTASQLTSPAYVPAVQSNINDFRTGGRSALEPIVEPILDAVSSTAWYVLASPGRIDTVEYCYLDGAEGPIIESQIGFEMDGISYKCREDFATKAIDYRGLYKANGA